MSDNGTVKITVKNTSTIANFDSETQTQFYDWSIYIETEPPEFLKQNIKEVIYNLHPSFPESKVRVQKTSPNFKLVSKGWGEFTVNIEIILDSGKKATIQHYLLLSTRGGITPKTLNLHEDFK